MVLVKRSVGRCDLPTIRALPFLSPVLSTPFLAPLKKINPLKYYPSIFT